MTISTTARSKLFVGTSLVHPAVDQDDYETDSYTEVGEIEDLSEMGPEGAELTFRAIPDLWMRRRKGGLDAGAVELVCARDPEDPGQNILRAAVIDPLAFNFRVQFNDHFEEGGIDSRFYFRAVVLTGRMNMGQADNITRQTFRLGIDGALLEVPAAEAPVITFDPVAGALLGGTEDTPYTDTVTASGGIGTASYAVTAGALPTGLSLNASTGEISGTPTVASVYNFTITATFALGGVGSAAYSITVSV